jgi:hypothetical protein
LAQGACEFEEAVGQGGFAVVDMSNYAEITNELGIHEFFVHSSVPQSVLGAKLRDGQRRRGSRD